MPITHRFRLALAIVCLLAARTPVDAQNAQALLRRAQLVEPWIETITWLGVALLLGLVLVAARLPELAGDQVRWLGAVLRRSHARRAASVREREAQAAGLEPPQASLPAAEPGGPALGPGKHFLVVFFAHAAVFAVAIANHVSRAAPERRAVDAIVLLALALGAAALASTVSAVSMAIVPRSFAGIAILCGTLTLLFATHALPPLVETALPAILGATVLSAILTGGVEELNRRPLPDSPPDAGGPAAAG